MTETMSLDNKSTAAHGMEQVEKYIDEVLRDGYKLADDDGERVLVPRAVILTKTTLKTVPAVFLETKTFGFILSLC